MSRPHSRFRQVRDVADAQLGLITAAQLAEIGVHTGTTSRRSLGGMWTRVLPGVHLVDGGQPSRLQRERAALLYAGNPSLITGLTGCRHFGVRALGLQHYRDDRSDTPEPVHTLIPHDRRRSSHGFVRAERTHRFPIEVVRRNGLALAPLPRAVGDAARRLRTAHDALEPVAEVVQRGLVTVEELRQELDDGPRRGSALFRDALDLVARGAQSVSEGDLVRLITDAGIPAAYFNVRLVTSSGRFVAIADCWLDDVGLPIESDSRAHHADEIGFERTVRRNARYAAAGASPLTLLPSDIRSRPQAVLADIHQARSAAAARGRPDLHMEHVEARTAGVKPWRWGA
jgi:hypothetical protein